MTKNKITECNHLVGVNVNSDDIGCIELEMVREHYIVNGEEFGYCPLFWLITKSKKERFVNLPSGFIQHSYMASRFKRCPDCGHEIDWKDISKRVDKWLTTKDSDHCKDYFIPETKELFINGITNNNDYADK